MSYIKNVLIPLFLLAVLTACGDSSETDSKSKAPVESNSGRPTAVAWLELALNSQYTTRSFYTGRVEASRRSDLGFELGGRLKSVSVDEGDRVAKGDVLAQLDTDRLRAQLQEAEALVAQAKAQSALAQSTLSRLEEARAFDGVSVQQFDEARNASDTSNAAVEAANSRLARVVVDVDKAKLVAPYDGVVLARHYDEGQVLGAGQAVLSVQETTDLQVRVGVAGRATDQLEPGGLYTLVVNERPVRATLRSVLPVRNSVTRTVDALFVLEIKEAGSIHAGDLAQLELRRAVETDGFWVPLTALAEGERGLWNAYALVRRTQADKNSTHVVQARAVEVLYQDGARAYINGALKPEERIVPTGLNRIVPGQQVVLQAEGL